MKKFTAILLTLVLALSLAACGSDTTTASDGEGTTAPATEPQDTTTQEDTNAGTASVATGRTLVVYFSATGNTQTAAETIADLTGGDLFPLEPAAPYTDEDLNWTDESSRVVQEHDNPEARDVALVADTVDNWEAYDTVFLGYPIWLAYHKLIQCTQLA